MPAGERVVGQRGFAAAYINNEGRKTGAGSLNESQRRFEMGPVPADDVRRFCFVNLFPMCLCVHGDLFDCSEQRPRDQSVAADAKKI